MISKKIFGLYNGNDIYEYTLSGDISVSVINFGATVTALKVPSKHGLLDVALGMTSVSDQIEKGDYMGAVVGRCANRIEDGRFRFQDKDYTLAVNNGTNHLHGGIVGFDKKVYSAKIRGNSLVLSSVSPDMEEGYPSEVAFKVVYKVDGAKLSIEYFAEADGDTVFNVTNHTYFNLNGESDESVLDNVVFINADAYTPIKNNLIPTGKIEKVKGTPFDFTSAKAIGKDIDGQDSQLTIAGGYDHNFCLNGSFAASAYSKKSGVKMEVFTDRPGMQFYSGNFLKGQKGKSVYRRRAGFCFETQLYPDAVNKPNFPSATLKKYEKFYSKTEFIFSIEK